MTDANNDTLARLLRIDDETALPGHSDGIQAAYAFSPEEWRADATRVATALARDGHPWTIDDLRGRGVQEPDRPQRWGSLVAALKAAGVIRLHSVTLHRPPSGDLSGIRVWVGTADAQEVDAE
ncbi:hypothetical protein CGQ24_07335 [Arthrobacter sp. 7749]|nr:hypothetical protein CGQ24_07335 [Arthrobacter sp. 7749]